MGCEGFLDERPNKSRLIPDTLDDLYALLDNEEELNRIPALGIIGSDDMVTNDIGYNNYYSPSAINGYIWNAEIFEGSPSVDWNVPYRAIFIANVVLEKLEEFENRNKYDIEELSDLRGMALFFRAHHHFQLAQIFADTYRPQTAGSTLGIPYRNNTSISANEKRSPLNLVYQGMMDDLQKARNLLPEWQPIKTRPSQKATEVLLARIYMTMQEYEKAEEYADLVLATSAFQLMDYSQINPTVNYPFAPYNAEVIWHSRQVNHEFNVANPTTFVHPEIWQSYTEHDLRKKLYYLERPDGYNFRGSYTGSLWFFGGIALEEVYFIAAEAKYRNGKTEEAIELMNKILTTRFEEGTYRFMERNLEDVLGWILSEKRKSLVFRGTNWVDLRRLNLDPVQARILTRTVNGVTYRLQPSSNRYTYPIPLEEMNLNPLEQNNRD